MTTVLGRYRTSRLAAAAAGLAAEARRDGLLRLVEDGLRDGGGGARTCSETYCAQLLVSFVFVGETPLEGFQTDFNSMTTRRRPSTAIMP